MRVVRGPRKDPRDLRFFDRADRRLDLLLADFHAVDVELHTVGARPRWTKHGHRHPHQFADAGGEIADAEFVVHCQLGEQTQADEEAALAKTLAGFVEADVSGTVVLTSNVGAALADNVAADVVTVARPDAENPVTVIQQGKPVAKGEHQIRLQRG